MVDLNSDEWLELSWYSGHVFNTNNVFFPSLARGFGRQQRPQPVFVRFDAIIFVEDGGIGDCGPLTCLETVGLHTMDVVGDYELIRETIAMARQGSQNA